MICININYKHLRMTTRRIKRRFVQFLESATDCQLHTTPTIVMMI